MGNRKLPFGYRMVLGEITIQPAEADLVRLIFHRYSTGATLGELTKILCRQDISYDTGRTWNKNMVSRILEDGRYIGDIRRLSRRSSSAQRQRIGWQGLAHRGKHRHKRYCVGSAAHRPPHGRSRLSQNCSTNSYMTQTASNVPKANRSLPAGERRRN